MALFDSISHVERQRIEREVISALYGDDKERKDLTVSQRHMVDSVVRERIPAMKRRD